MSVKEKIRQRAIELGFDLAGITNAEALDSQQEQAFRSWLEAGFSGQMQYMHRNLEKRIAPIRLLGEAKSVIVVGLNYKLPENKRYIFGLDESCGRVARYAQYEDYHIFFKRLLHQLAEFIIKETGDSTRLKVCVDSVPLAERAFAARAGLGFIGRNHMLINPELGPEIFLGELITNLELEADEPLQSDCAGCDRCIKACPAGALRPDGQFDSRRCISYLTIEHKGEIEDDLARLIGNRLFGCDECVLACPYQHKAPPCRNSSFKHYPDRDKVELEEILRMSEEEFEVKFGDSPLFRPGLDILKRNARICLANLQQG